MALGFTFAPFRGVVGERYLPDYGWVARHPRNSRQNLAKPFLSRSEHIYSFRHSAYFGNRLLGCRYPVHILLLLGVRHRFEHCSCESIFRQGRFKFRRLVVTAYADSADACDSLSDAYLAASSSSSDTDERRKLIRDGAQENLKQLSTAR